jgi:hypothetical protein
MFSAISHILGVRDLAPSTTHFDDALIVDEIADNTCHFGINSFFADNGLDDVQSWLYFPADALQMRAIIKRVFFERGLRFVFSTRAKVPYLLKPGSDDKLLATMITSLYRVRMKSSWRERPDTSSPTATCCIAAMMRFYACARKAWTWALSTNPLSISSMSR